VAALVRLRELVGPYLSMSIEPGRRHAPDVSPDHQHVDRISTQTTIFVLIVIIVVVYAIQWILLPFVIAGLLAYVFTPLLAWLARRTGLPRPLFAGLVFLALLSFGSLVGLLGLPPLARELLHVVTDLQGTIRALADAAIGQRTVNLFGQSMNSGQLAEAAAAGIRDWLLQSGRLAFAGAVAFASAFGLLLTLVLLFYFLISGPAIMTRLLWLVPPKERPLIRHVWSSLDPVLRRYFVGVIVVVAYAAAAAYIGLGLVLGLPHAVFLALLTGVLEMIPMIGPGAAAIIAGLVAIRSATGIGPIIAYAVYAAALRLSIDQLFGPLALGSAAQLHPVMIIFCFLAGGLLFGISGVILSVPVALTVRTTLAILYDEPDNGSGTDSGRARG
jgi:predicted PurR-regulated permease PerM